MKTLVVAAILLVGLLSCGAVPSSRWSCYKKVYSPQATSMVLRDRGCHNVASGAETMIRPVADLTNHFWEGNSCDIICYCNFSELLCCPRDMFFGPKISFIIPCKTF